MKAIESYHDLCTEIEVLELRLEGLIAEMNHLSRQMHSSPRTKLVASYSGMPGAGMDASPLDKQFKALCTVNERIDDVKDIISLKVEYKQRMEARMSEYEGLEYKVAFMRDIECKPLKQIHEELEMSYEYIRRISARIPRMRTA